jgi:hypothetical protein
MMNRVEPDPRWPFAEWRRRLSDASPESTERFTNEQLTGLDGPVQRHLRQAIQVGTPLSRCVELTMRGSLKIGRRWLPFRARQILCPHRGFIWSARVAGVITGSDRYLDGIGGMDWRLGGLFSIVHVDGPDVSRSAAGRGGAEAIWLPTSLLPRFGVSWSAQDERNVSAHYLIDDNPIDLHLRIGESGELDSLVFDRWGDPDQKGHWDWYPFGGTFSGRRTFGGISIPSAGRLGWHYGTDRWSSGEFFRYQLTGLRRQVPALGPVRGERR